jgi:S-formylglutathione hydrolase FrmB
MRFRPTAALLAALLSFPVLSLAAGLEGPAPRIECNSLDSKVLSRAVRYCVVLPPSYDQNKTRKYPVLYFFHGLGDNEQMFIHGGAFNLVEDLWERGEIGEFLIVTPAGGASFYINSRSGKVRYEDFLVEEFLPRIEARYRISSGRGSRGVGGVSMGGYGALHLAFRHPELFAAVAVHSPALIDEFPAFVAPGASGGMRARLLEETFGSPPDPAFWERQSPLTLAKTARFGGLKIYFDCGDHDDYGFEDGAKSLDKILTARQVPHQAHIYPGRHDWEYFAEHLPASLKFESQAFGK